MRIGNIAFRIQRRFWNHDEEKSEYVDIVKYKPNPNYGKESEYEGFDGEFYFKSDNPHTKVHKDCFQNPECCLTIATINIDSDPDVRIVGLRAFELEKEERDDLDVIVKIAYQYAVELYKHKNKEQYKGVLNWDGL